MATDTSLAGKALAMSAAEIARAIGGRVASGDGGARVTGVSTDSRTVAKGNLFVALAGEKFDGHGYVKDVAAKGAGAVLVAETRAAEFGSLGIPVIAGGDDTLLALGRLGRAHRDRLKAPVVGVTGSAGKSTAKEMTAAVLAWGGRRVLKTEGNLNNRIGVPLTILGARPDHDALVVEMGISFPGEMSELVKIAMPDVRIALNAGLAHVEFLKDEDGVAREKATIFDQRRPDDVMIWNADDARIAREAATRTGGRRLSFGRAAGADVRCTASATTAIGRLAVDFEIGGTRRSVELGIVGAHHVTNVLAAAAAGSALGVPLDEIATGLSQRFTPMPGRGDVKVLAGDVVVLDDTYNANPTSTSAALGALAEIGAHRTRTIAALGDMLELGSGGPGAHEAIGREAGSLRLDALYCVGELSKRTAEGARAAGVKDVRHFADRPSLSSALANDLRKGDVVLAKGSRGSRMDEVVAALIAARGQA